MIPTRFEIYAIVLAVIALTMMGAYYKGRGDERDDAQQKQLAANATKMTDYQATLDKRNEADDQARGKALAFVDDISKRMDTVNAKLSKLPAVVVDARGCSTLTDAAGVRWNNVELVPTGQALDPPGDAVGPVRPAEVPRAR